MAVSSQFADVRSEILYFVWEKSSGKAIPKKMLKASLKRKKKTMLQCKQPHDCSIINVYS